MSTSLYDMSVSSYIQSLAGVATVMEKGRNFASDNNIVLDDIVEARLKEDMLPFRFQILSVVHHSMGAVESIKLAVTSPPTSIEPLDYDALETLVHSSLDQLRAVDADELNAYAGKQVVFKMGDLQMPFTTENFVLSFSLPNLYFHAATAYDILRQQGVPLSKRDFLGEMRVGI